MNLGSVISGLASNTSVGSGIAGLASAAASIYTNNKNIEFQERQNQQNLNWQERMINEQREYDDPSNQMARLEAAGINPVLAGTNASVTPGNTSDAMPTPATRAPQFTSNLGTDIGNAVGTSLDVLKADAEIKKNEADTAKARFDVTAGQKMLDHQIGLLQSKSKYFFKYADTMEKLGNLYDAQMLGQMADNFVKDHTTIERIKAFSLDNANKQADLLVKEDAIKTNSKKRQFIDKQSELMTAQIQECFARITTEAFKQQNLQSSTSLNYSQAELNKEKVKTEQSIRKHYATQDRYITEQRKNIGFEQSMAVSKFLSDTYFNISQQAKEFGDFKIGPINIPRFTGASQSNQNKMVGWSLDAYNMYLESFNDFMTPFVNGSSTKLNQSHE